MQDGLASNEHANEIAQMRRVDLTIRFDRIFVENFRDWNKMFRKYEALRRKVDLI